MAGQWQRALEVVAGILHGRGVVGRFCPGMGPPLGGLAGAAAPAAPAVTAPSVWWAKRTPSAMPIGPCWRESERVVGDATRGLGGGREGSVGATSTVASGVGGGGETGSGREVRGLSGWVGALRLARQVCHSTNGDSRERWE